MVNVATELHTHTHKTTLTDNCSPATYRECEQHSFSSLLPLSLCPWLYTQCIYIYTGTQREGAALSLTDTHCSPYRCVCVCIGAELFTQTPCV